MPGWRCPTTSCRGGVATGRAGRMEAGERGVEVGEPGSAYSLEHLGGRPDGNEPAAGREHDHVVASFDVLDAVCREHDCASVRGHAVQAVHEVSGRRGVETAGRFVEE